MLVKFTIHKKIEEFNLWRVMKSFILYGFTPLGVRCFVKSIVSWDEAKVWEYLLRKEISALYTLRPPKSYFTMDLLFSHSIPEYLSRIQGRRKRRRNA